MLLMQFVAEVGYIYSAVSYLLRNDFIHKNKELRKTNRRFAKNMQRKRSLGFFVTFLRRIVNFKRFYADASNKIRSGECQLRNATNFNVT